MRNSATQALFESHRPHEAIEKTAEIYEEISRKERDIENLCMKLLLQQQPVARDLRVISSALKMIYDMQRIGNQASDITEIIRFVKGEDVINRIHIKKMTAATTKMVADSISSFVSKDLVLAQSVIAYDDVVDELFSKVREELVGILTRHPDSGAVCVDLLMVSKHWGPRGKYRRLGGVLHRRNTRAHDLTAGGVGETGNERSGMRWDSS